MDLNTFSRQPCYGGSMEYTFVIFLEPSKFSHFPIFGCLIYIKKMLAESSMDI